MNLYLVTAPSNELQVDIYNAAVICAASPEEAVEWHPNPEVEKKPWNERYGEEWIPYADRGSLEVKLIGTADPGLPEGIVFASFIFG
jgi:hypothetical protein